MDRKYKICFENESVQMSYKILLQHSCPICNNDDERHRSNLRGDENIGSHIFQTFKQLEQHVRRNHEMFYCDLCAEHLKVTPFDWRSMVIFYIASQRILFIILHY